MLQPQQMSSPRLMKKVWAAVENPDPPDPVTVTLQERSDPPNLSQNEAEGDYIGVRGSSFMGEEIAPRSGASSDNRLRQTSIMGGDSRIDNAAGEEHGEKNKEEGGGGGGEGAEQQQQQQQHQQQHIMGNLPYNRPSRRWFPTKKFCKIPLCILLAVAVVA